MWTSHFAPTGKYISSALLNQGTTVSSGKIAMDAANGWSINSYGTAGKAAFKNWDMGVLPAYNGKVSGPLDADTAKLVRVALGGTHGTCPYIVVDGVGAP
jgi:ABC-type glycerol-3-phosphate transport system substrate-binding protein